MISAATIAQRLGLPAPTIDQTAVIESDMAPALVIAGAGSGKTETMASRVVWLLANDLVAPSQVLGMTFTRKAAGELAARIHRRIAQLGRSGLVATAFDPLDTPVVTTYNAFANGVFREHAHLIGRESDSSVLSEAAAWLLARRLVLRSSDDRLIDLDKSPDVLTEAIVRLSRAMTENRVSAADLIAFATSFGALADLPRGGRGTTAVMRDVATAVESISALPALVELADEFTAQKRMRGAIEFADQVVLAGDILAADPALADDYRDRYRVVLLDEYQDTSVSQTALLSTLFADQAVMAVGDPHQSIYGWRGASAANLTRFTADFAVRTDAHRFDLRVSWRNPRSVLQLANTIIRPFSSSAVAGLTERPDAPAGEVAVAFAETIEDEAESVAEWFAGHLDQRGERPSAAILCRSLKNVHPFTAALARAGVPFRVLGIGGLLEEPAVADLLCTLRVLRHADANAELIRLLSGARWRIGVRDLDALGRLAGWLTTRDHTRLALDADVAASVRSSVGDDEQRSLVDALDFVQTAPDDHSRLAAISSEGRARMRRFAHELSELRAKSGMDLSDLVVEVEHSTLLDIEVAARRDAAAGRSALDAFEEQVAAFQADDPTADLGGFLAWIAEAERRDALAPRSDEPEAGVVQILTIHGAKGLEWDLVAVPRLVDGELPAAPRTTRGWLGFAELPYEFRADSSELPVLAWRQAAVQTDFVRALDDFKEAERARQLDEERRLAYVAVTRSRSRLLMTGSFWSSQIKPRMPSVFVREAESASLLASPLPTEPAEETNPLAAAGEQIPWPRDPLGARRASVEAAADRVSASAAQAAPRSPADGDAVPFEHTGDDPAVCIPSSTRWDDLIDVLLAERDSGANSDLRLPRRVAASHFKDYIDDAAQVLESRQRPMPRRPFRQTRVGTEFHSWVESRFAAATPSLSFEPLPPEDGDLAEDELDFGRTDDGELWNDSSFFDTASRDDRADRLAELQRRFAASAWGDRVASDVELELHLPLAGHIVVCKIDAVFAVGDRFEIVDWKPGAKPTSTRDRELREYQLSLYRLAYAKWKGIPLDRIDAVFYFVADDLVVAPTTLLDERELTRRWSRVQKSVSPR